MNNFHFTKIIASVSPILAKETVLSKIINLVDVFSITLSHGYDDNNKKYIDTLMKLNNSKTIILETRGNNVRVKNTDDINIEQGQDIIIDYSEYTQESDKKIYVDYSHLGELSIGDKITFEQSQAVAKVKAVKEDYVECEIIRAEKKKVFIYDRVSLPHNEEETEFISDQDKKDILRGLEYNAHIIALAACNSAAHLEDCKNFLSDHSYESVKVFAKIETESGFSHLEEIANIADGIILSIDMIQAFEDEKVLEQWINLLREKGIPVLVTYNKKQGTLDYPLTDIKTIEKICKTGTDGIMIETLIDEDTIFDFIDQLGKNIEKYETNLQSKEIGSLQNYENEMRDYIICNAYRVTRELDIKAIVCFTEHGYSAAKIASLNPKVPIITFTKENSTYRFLNLIRGVKGYKISQSFDYESLKRIGKEMIRIIFKGNISLDDKILIIQTNEDESDEKKGMNGIELYNFKNI